MSLKIVTGTLADFFDSAREIDTSQPLTPKQALWVEAADLVKLLQSQRLRLVHYLKGKSPIILQDLAQAMQRPPHCVSRDLGLLAKYHLIRLSASPHTPRKLHQLVEPLIGKEGVELRVKM